MSGTSHSESESLSPEESDIECSNSAKMEKQRRVVLGENFAKLKEEVPSLSTKKKASQRKILEHSIDYIRIVKKEEGSVPCLEQLKKENLEMEKEIALLESMAAANSLESSDSDLDLDSKSTKSKGSEGSQAKNRPVLQARRRLTPKKQDSTEKLNLKDSDLKEKE